MNYLAAIMTGMMLMASGGAYVLDGRLADARAELAKVEQKRDQYADANTAAQATIRVCKAVNQQNAAQRAAVKERAAAAIARADALAKQLSEVKPIDYQDAQCRRLDDALPAGFARQLCVPGANCQTESGNDRERNHHARAGASDAAG